METQSEKENQEALFIGPGSFIVFFMLALSACTSQETKETITNDSFPVINIAAENDTIVIGETYKAKVSLSDTSLLFLKDPDGSKTRIHPYFELNDSLFHNGDDFFEYEVEINDIPQGESFPYYQEWSCSVVFPNPIMFEGDVKLSKRIGFTIVEE